MAVASSPSAVAGILIVILLPLYIFIFYYNPEDKGLKAYQANEPPATEGVEVVDNLTARDCTLGDAIRTYQLWLLVFSQFCYWGIGNYLVLAHTVNVRT